MNKRRCGTCRFFQEAGLAGSGWCHHPLRRTTSDAMIMVRRNELACRNDWSQDLWAAQTAGDRVAAVEPDPVDRVAARRLDPATPDQIAAVLRAQQTTSGGDQTIQEDVVVSEGLVLPAPPPEHLRRRREPIEPRLDPVEREPEPEAVDRADLAVGTIDARAAIFRAREQFRTRTMAPTRPNGVPAQAEAESGQASGVAATESPVPDGYRSTGEAFDGAGGPGRSASLGSQGAADRFGTVPELKPGIELPRPKRVTYQPAIAGLDADVAPATEALPDDPPIDDAFGHVIPMDGDTVGVASAAEPRSEDLPVTVDPPVALERPRPAEARKPRGLGFFWDRRPRAEAVPEPAVDEEDWSDDEFAADGSSEPWLSAEPDVEVGARHETAGDDEIDEIDDRAVAVRRAPVQIDDTPWLPMPPVPAREVSAREMPAPVRAALVRPEASFETLVVVETEVEEPTPDPAWAIEDPDEALDAELEELEDPAYVAVAEAAPEPAPVWSPPAIRPERPVEVDPPLDMVIRIAPDVPRICRTCRDFRPAEGGERGWCTNQWAFTHRRMVDLNELPCGSALGCWWLPADHLWLEQADISGHGQPTPLVDHFMPDLGEIEEPDRRRRRS